MGLNSNLKSHSYNSYWLSVTLSSVTLSTRLFWLQDFSCVGKDLWAEKITDSSSNVHLRQRCSYSLFLYYLCRIILCLSALGTYQYLMEQAAHLHFRDICINQSCDSNYRINTCSTDFEAENQEGMGAYRQENPPGQLFYTHFCHSVDILFYFIALLTLWLGGTLGRKCWKKYW